MAHYYNRKMSEASIDIPSTNRHAPDWLILCIACIAQFMVVLDVSIVNVALPRMGHDLHFTQSSAQWVVNAYVLTFAGFLLLGGRACDFFGRRKVYITGIIIFTLASIGAGVAQTGTQMITIRAIQGLGGAILSPATLTIIVTTFHGPRLPKAIGAWSAVAGAGGAVGGLLGGILTGWASWRWVFFINVPFGIVAGTVAAMYLREMRNRDATTKLDVTGSVLVTGGLASAIYAVVNTTTHAWTSSTTLGWLFLGLALWRCSSSGRQGRVASTGSVQDLQVATTHHGQSHDDPRRRHVLCDVVLPHLLLPVRPRLRPGEGRLRLLPDGARDHHRRPISSRLLSRTGVAPAAPDWRGPRDLGFPLDLTHQAGRLLRRSYPRCLVHRGLRDGAAVRAARDRRDLRCRPRRCRSGVGILNTARQVGGSLALAVLATVATDVKHQRLLTASLAAAYTSGYHRVFQISAL